jgi:hypothetical protein
MADHDNSPVEANETVALEKVPIWLAGPKTFACWVKANFENRKKPKDAARCRQQNLNSREIASGYEGKDGSPARKTKVVLSLEETLLLLYEIDGYKDIVTRPVPCDTHGHGGRTIQQF